MNKLMIEFKQVNQNKTSNQVDLKSLADFSLKLKHAIFKHLNPSSKLLLMDTYVSIHVCSLSNKKIILIFKTLFKDILFF